MQTLSIDIETYSDVNLSKCGVYKYAESQPDSPAKAAAKNIRSIKKPKNEPEL